MLFQVYCDKQMKEYREKYVVSSAWNVGQKTWNLLKLVRKS